jgi:hypothetical protein
MWTLIGKSVETRGPRHRVLELARGVPTVGRAAGVRRGRFAGPALQAPPYGPRAP